MLDTSLLEFGKRLESAGGRLALLRDGSGLKASVSSFQDFADALSESPDYKGHLAGFYQVGERSRHIHAAFLHRVARGAGAGGVRRKPYSSIGELSSDGLRLAQGMGYKNSLAGLWWGGGKGVIGVSQEGVDRNQVYQEFGRFVSSLGGSYYTAEDVGTTPEDMATIFANTRFCTCIPADFGGSGNPSPATARGVFVGIQAVLQHLGKDLQGARVALQGLGEVGFRLAQHLDAAGAVLTVYDPDESKMKKVFELSDRHRGCEAEKILRQEVDVLAPCALGGVLNEGTIAELKCRAVCGAANNQLQRDQDAIALHQRGIIYVPDFLVNRMGIVNCADEQYGRLEPDPGIERHLSWEWEHAIGPLILRLLKSSESSGRPALAEALSRAEELMGETHPIWPGRVENLAGQCFQRWSL